jgi:hypothetical protein
MVVKIAGHPVPEVFLSTTETSASVQAALRRGEVRKIGPRLYTTNLVDEPATIVGRHLWPVLALLFPGTVVSYRTALTMKPTDGGTVFLTGPYRRQAELPGHAVRILQGPGALPGDMPVAQTLWISSEERSLLECLSIKRARGSESVAVPRAEMETILERRLAVKGEPWANRLRDQAREIAPLLGMQEAFTELDRLIGALLGTRRGRVSAPTAVARAAGEPYDGLRVERFSRLLAALRAWTPADRPDPVRSGPAFENLAFFDAYFSNFIEGTEFRVDEAADIVFRNMIPRGRPADAHDVLGTYRLVASGHEMGRSMVPVAGKWPEFEAVLVSRHQMIMQGRPEKRPGEFKEEANYAGDTDFVDPVLVKATLRKGLEMLPALPEPFQRAVYMMFLISEVHPFADGNGRLARAMMNAEMVAGGQRRILIPTSFRIDYIGGLRRLTRQDAPDTLIEMLDYAQSFTAAVDFTDYRTAELTLRECRAFETADDVRLRMPKSSV